MAEVKNNRHIRLIKILYINVHAYIEDANLKLEMKKRTKIDEFLINLNPKYFPLYAFLITLMTYTLSFSLIGALGNGLYTISTGDLNSQVIPIIYSLIDVFKGKHSFWYSWNLSLGSGTISTYSYYALSPFNLIFLLLGRNNVELATAIVITLKAACAAFSFQLFISEFLKNKYYETVLFSVMYALCGYSICYYQMIIFMDGVLIFPIIALGIVRLINGKGAKLLIFGYSYIFIVHFYMGYIVGLSSFVLFCCYYIYMINICKNKIAIILNYIFSVLVSIGLSAAIWLPAVRHVFEMGNSTDIYNKPFYYGFVLFLNNLFIGQFQSIDGYVPYIYCGTLGVISLPLFFLNKKISKRKKILFGVALSFFVIAFFVPQINLIMHGFDQPNMFGYRYSFVFSFLLLIILSIEYPYLRVNFKTNMIYYFVFLVSYSFVFWISRFRFTEALKDDYSTKMYVFFVGLFFIVIWSIILSLYKSPKIDWITMRVIVTFVVTLEMFTNICICLNSNIGIIQFLTDYYDNAHNNTVEILDKYEASDKFVKPYRYIYQDKFVSNIALFYDKSSLSFFSSLLNHRVVECMRNLGFYYVANYMGGNGWTPVTATILGIDCVIDGEDIKSLNKNETVKLEVNSNYYQNYAVNSRTLPIAFASDNDILDYKHTSSAFENQNRIISALTGENIVCFSDTDMNIKLQNTKYEENEEGIRIWNLGYPENDGYVVYTTKEKKYMPLYVDLYNTVEVDTSTIGIPLEPQYGRFMSMTYNITLVPNQIFYVDVDKNGSGGFTMTIPKNVKYIDYIKGYYVYYDSEALDKAVSILKNHSLENVSINDGRVSGQISVDEDCILFTSIPYESGWMAYVDGNSSEIIPIVEDTFVGIKLKKGTHNILLDYKPPLKNVGIIVSVLSISILIIYEVIFSGKISNAKRFSNFK